MTNNNFGKAFVPTHKELEKAGYHMWDGVYGNGSGIFYSLSKGWHVGFSDTQSEIGPENFYGFRIEPENMEQVLAFSKIIVPFWAVYEWELVEAYGFKKDSSNTLKEAVSWWWTLTKASFNNNGNSLKQKIRYFFTIPDSCLEKVLRHPSGLEVTTYGTGGQHRMFSAKINGKWEYFYPKNKEEFEELLKTLN